MAPSLLASKIQPFPSVLIFLIFLGDHKPSGRTNGRVSPFNWPRSCLTQGVHYRLSSFSIFSPLFEMIPEVVNPKTGSFQLGGVQQ